MYYIFFYELVSRPTKLLEMQALCHSRATGDPSRVHLDRHFRLRTPSQRQPLRAHGERELER
jgi:hypothetical protein